MTKMGMMFGMGGLGFTFNMGGNNQGARFNFNFIGIGIFLFVMALQFISHYLFAGDPSAMEDYYNPTNSGQNAYRRQGSGPNRSTASSSQHSAQRQARQSAPPTSSDYGVYEAIYNLALVGLIAAIFYLTRFFPRFRNAPRA